MDETILTINQFLQASKFSIYIYIYPIYFSFRLKIYFHCTLNDIFVVNFQAFDHKDLTAYISLMNTH